MKQYSYSVIMKELDIKPFEAVDDAATSDLFNSVGLATTAFEYIQDEIVQLFNELCGGSHSLLSPMARIIGVTTSFGVKMDLVREAADIYVKDDDNLEALLKWFKVCKKAAEIRNKIAHGRATSRSFMHNGEGMTGLFLTPSTFNFKAYDPSESRDSQFIYCLNTTQVKGYAETFFRLKRILFNIRAELVGIDTAPDPSFLKPSLM